MKYLAVALIVAAAAVACARPRLVPDDFGIRPCPPEADRDVLSPFATQCWFYLSGDRVNGRGGRWRILSHDRHLEALVLYVEARDHRGAIAIARQIVDNQRRMFSEIAVYVRREGRPPADTRRVIWTREDGFAVFDFTSAAPPP